MLTIERRYKEGPYYVTRRHIIENARPFMSFGLFAEACKECFVCGHKFDESEQIYIASMRSDRPRIVCEQCAKRINGQQAI